MSLSLLRLRPPIPLLQPLLSGTRHYATRGPRRSPTAARAERASNAISGAASAPMSRLLPVSYIISAQKSKLTSLSPSLLIPFLETYLKMCMPTPPSAQSAIDALLQHRHLKPADIFTLSRILNMALQTTMENPTPEQRRHIARHLEMSAALLEVGEATAHLAQKVRGMKPIDPWRQNNEGIILKLLRRQAEKGHGECLRELGHVLLREENIADAAKAFEDAGKKGDGEGWRYLGQLLAQRGLLKEAQQAWEKGCEVEDKLCFFARAMVRPVEETFDVQEECLLKAAASGVVPAAHNLGVLYAELRQKKEVRLAKEWYQVGIEAGVVQSVVARAKLELEEGGRDRALKVLEALEQEGGVGILGTQGKFVEGTAEKALQRLEKGDYFPEILGIKGLAQVWKVPKGKKNMGITDLESPNFTLSASAST